ncbi:hypothetical protein BDB00DRAFT_800732 [Zychaea mexicana]|uniref:uncharacterized protein n=1 Tax=Zychaea mexicana TaxID=64656 RepID=UPI0022FDC004|nr:uncharacterized protein BDB00DRAFT_800732 [Zychaea mexicana]KAI9498030.1 hypothetical protein BDB00DRAFT_800732 [Zychaea mexicana]
MKDAALYIAQPRFGAFFSVIHHLLVAAGATLHIHLCNWYAKIKLISLEMADDLWHDSAEWGGGGYLARPFFYWASLQY